MRIRLHLARGVYGRAADLTDRMERVLRDAEYAVGLAQSADAEDSADGRARELKARGILATQLRKLAALLDGREIT